MYIHSGTHTLQTVSLIFAHVHTHMPLFIEAVISNLKQLLLLTDVQVAVSLSRSLREERCKLIQTMCVRRQNLFFDRATKAAAGTAFQFHAWPSVNSKLIVDETMIRCVYIYTLAAGGIFGRLIENVCDKFEYNAILNLYCQCIKIRYLVSFSSKVAMEFS